MQCIYQCLINDPKYKIEVHFINLQNALFLKSSIINEESCYHSTVAFGKSPPNETPGEYATPCKASDYQMISGKLKRGMGGTL